MRRHDLREYVWGRVREEPVVVVQSVGRLERDRPEELALALDARAVVEVLPLERQVAEMEVVDRRLILDLDEVRTRCDVARLAAGEVVEPDAIAVDGIVRDAADEEGIVERGLRLRPGRQGDQEQREEEPRCEIEEPSRQDTQGNRDPAAEKARLAGQQDDRHLQHLAAAEQEVGCARSWVPAAKAALPKTT